MRGVGQMQRRLSAKIFSIDISAAIHEKTDHVVCSTCCRLVQGSVVKMSSALDIGTRVHKKTDHYLGTHLCRQV